jgi:hypothetical protein
MIPPSRPTGDVVIHEVLADEAAHYVRHDDLLSGGVERARDVDLWLISRGSALVVERLPGWAAYPRQSGSAWLFLLRPGQIGPVSGELPVQVYRMRLRPELVR